MMLAIVGETSPVRPPESRVWSATARLCHLNSFIDRAFVNVCSMCKLPTKYMSLCTNRMHTQMVDTMLIMLITICMLITMFYIVYMYIFSSSEV